MNNVEFQIPKLRERIFELRLGFAGEPDDNIRPDRNARDRRADFIDQRAIRLISVPAAHPLNRTSH